MSCGSAVLPVTACFSGQCSYVHNLFEYCPHSTSINVTLMASNTLGDGQESEPTTITVVSGLLCILNFVYLLIFTKKTNIENNIYRTK